MKKYLFLLISFFAFIINVSSMELEISSPSSILIEASTGKVLFENNKDEKRPMASMTKIMSMILIMEQIEQGNLKYDDKVVISKEASSMGGSQIFLQENDEYKVSELLKSIAMASANDAVVALAEKTYGSKEEFINQMNKKAKELGLRNTNFINVHGLDEENHYSSAYDMAMMAKELIKYEDILNFTSVYEEYLQKPDGSQIWLVNTNKLVRFYDGVDGLKTGYTQNAGYCLTATAKKNNFRLISVVMGSDTIETRSSDTVKLLNYGFNTYKVNLIKSKNDVLGKIKVDKGKNEYVDVILKNDAIHLLNKNDKVGKYNFELSISLIKAPVKKNQIIGFVNIYDENNNLVNKVDITAKNEVLKANVLDYFKRNLKRITTLKKSY